MRHAYRIFCIIILFIFLIPVSGSSAASFSFSDDRFIGQFTTENLDAIIEEYELFDGWYWTTRAGVLQTYHGVPECPGWTDTAVNKNHLKGYLKDWYGCRWGMDRVPAAMPNAGGFGECFGFAQFIGYLLSGDVNPSRDWDFFYSLESAGGFRVGDIIRVEYRAKNKQFQHSAVVYAVNGEEILFLQASSSKFNRISVGNGFSDGNHNNETDLYILGSIPSIKICRSRLNMQ